MGARLETYNEDEIIIREGELSERMFLVLEGSVALYMNYGTPSESVLGVIGKNKVFGEMGLFAKEKSIYTAVAFTDVKAAWFDERTIAYFFKAYPENTMNIVKSMGRSYKILKENLTMAMDEIKHLTHKENYIFHDELPDVDDTTMEAKDAEATNNNEIDFKGLRYINHKNDLDKYVYKASQQLKNK